MPQQFGLYEDLTVRENLDLYSDMHGVTAVKEGLTVLLSSSDPELGPNGAGKTTTFRMLCGLLPASAATLKVAGVDVRQARASARQHLGYVAQKFSLYGQLTVGEKLEFFARAYGLERNEKRERIAWALSQFKLAPFVRLPSAQLPGGFKQRLSMAAALLHRPEILFLDEPTRGADA